MLASGPKRSHCKVTVYDMIMQTLENNDPTDTGIKWINDRMFAVDFEIFAGFYNKIGNSTAKWQSIKNRMTKSKSGFVCQNNIEEPGYKFVYSHIRWENGLANASRLNQGSNLGNINNQSTNANHVTNHVSNQWAGGQSNIGQALFATYPVESSPHPAVGGGNNYIDWARASIPSEARIPTGPPKEVVNEPCRIPLQVVPNNNNSFSNAGSANTTNIYANNSAVPTDFTSASQIQPSFNVEDIFVQIFNLEILPENILKSSQPQAWQNFSVEIADFIDKLFENFSKYKYDVTQNDKDNWLILLRNEGGPSDSQFNISTSGLSNFGSVLDLGCNYQPKLDNLSPRVLPTGIKDYAATFQ